MAIIKRNRKGENVKKTEYIKKLDKNKKTEAQLQQDAESTMKMEELLVKEKALKDEKNGIGREAMILFRRSMYSSKLIGTAEDLIPFAWRQPLKLSDKKKMSRVFKAIAYEQEEREMRMPSLTNSN